MLHNRYFRQQNIQTLAVIRLMSLLLLINSLLINIEAINEISNRRRLKISPTKMSNHSNKNNNRNQNYKQTISHDVETMKTSNIFLSEQSDDNNLTPFKDNFFFKRQIIVLLIPTIG